MNGSIPFAIMVNNLLITVSLLYLKGNKMETIFIDYLFNKNFFVAQKNAASGNVQEIWFSLGKLFNIEVRDRFELLDIEMIHTAERNLGKNVPEPFYRGFPQSVLQLTPDQLILDQIIHYLTTYGMGDFSEARHSILEPDIKRKVFDEEAEIKKFTILTETEAVEKIAEYTDQLLSGTRQLSDEQYALVKVYLTTYHQIPDHCASKNTAMKLIVDLRDPELYKFITLSDIPKLAETLNWNSRNVYKHYSDKKLKLRNQDRKLIKKILDNMFYEFLQDRDESYIVKQIIPCFEQKAKWAGLLHHIHYKTKNGLAVDFMNFMRGKENYSIMSNFEKLMRMSHVEGYNVTPVTAAQYLLKEKGQGALLRNLDYLVSRCFSSDEIEQIISLIDTKNVILLYQLMLHYHQEQPEKRTFKFIKHSMMKLHTEGIYENQNRRTRLQKRERLYILNALSKQLQKLLSGRLGKVYISPEMENIALPIQEGASSGGYGTMTHGSRIHIPEGKKIRAFTYWEKVNDIDLSVIGLNTNNKQTEFSWRTMSWSKQSDALCYSGDQTAGYYGGSEYFDLDPVKFKAEYPEIRYLVFCNNLYSWLNGGFKSCICRAGYMLRDVEDSGEVFEPKTVKSSFTINCESSFAYLFAIDLEANDFIWLNLDRNSNTQVAGTTSMGFLTQYFDILKVMNVYEFFAKQATELVLSPSSADVIVSDEELDDTIASAINDRNIEVIHSYDTERIIQLMNV